jgi:hypothetical protein
MFRGTTNPEFWLPSDRKVRPLEARIPARNSFVVVLPALPVTAMNVVRKQQPAPLSGKGNKSGASAEQRPKSRLPDPQFEPTKVHTRIEVYLPKQETRNRGAGPIHVVLDRKRAKAMSRTYSPSIRRLAMRRSLRTGVAY